MQIIWANQALTSKGWQNDVRIALGDDGRITKIDVGTAREDGVTSVDILLPAPANLHSHAFQRAMAGLTEKRGPDPRDTFWTWRKLMYRFLDQLTPEHVEAIAALVQMEMLEAGFASVGEFHYLHHQPHGKHYDDIAELSGRIIAAATQSGIGLTLLPVFYQFGGCDGSPLAGGQQRFGNDFAAFTQLWQNAARNMTALPDDARIGVAPHSLRAVSREGLAEAIAFAKDQPFHLHLAEQVAEVEEVKQAYGARPVEWLLNTADVKKNWCLIHSTQMTPEETIALASTGAVAGLCPITESSLGDGIFDGPRYVQAGGHLGIGSDSNVRISLNEELRILEYSQRLRDRGRAVFATPDASAGRFLYDAICSGGAQAMGRASGIVEVGAIADLLALDGDNVDLESRSGDDILDTWIFAAGDNLVCDVWAAGRHMVTQGRHIHRAAISSNYRKTMRSLTASL